MEFSVFFLVEVCANHRSHGLTSGFSVLGLRLFGRVFSFSVLVLGFLVLEGSLLVLGFSGASCGWSRGVWLGIERLVGILLGC